MAHPPPRRRGLARDEADDRLAEVIPDPGGRFFLGTASDLADHDHRVGLAILGEELQRVDVRGADERIAADADARALAEADARQLMNRLVGERAALRDDADAAFLADVGGDDAGLRLAGRDEARTVRADQTRRGSIPEKR